MPDRSALLIEAFDVFVAKQLVKRVALDDGFVHGTPGPKRRPWTGLPSRLNVAPDRGASR